MLEIEAEFDLSLVVLSVGISMMGSTTATSAIEEVRKERDERKSYLWLMIFAFSLGGVSIWSLHFIGMRSLQLYIVDTETGERRAYTAHYHVLWTVASFFFAVFCAFIGALIAKGDKFFGQTANAALEEMVKEMEEEEEGRQGSTASAKGRAAAILPTEILLAALFSSPSRILVSGVIAGLGVLLMHYSGMNALRQQEISIEWKMSMILISVVVAIAVASTGFWIAFRVLQWKPFNEPLRFTASLVISLAVAATHYSAMFAARYVPNQSYNPLDSADLKGYTIVQTLFEAAMIMSVGSFFIVSTGLNMSLRNELLNNDAKTKAIRRVLQRTQRKIKGCKDLSEADKVLQDLIERYKVQKNTIQQQGGSKKNRLRISPLLATSWGFSKSKTSKSKNTSNYSNGAKTSDMANSTTISEK